jgi:nucleotide-binding universal stress UspA family protein
MYKTILVTLEATPTDRVIIEHVKQLASAMHSSVVLLHVATGVPAQFHGEGAAGKEIEEDRAYLAAVRGEFQNANIPVSAELGFGIPAKEILKWVEKTECELVAMGTHGHGPVADLFLGTTASKVQHHTSVPVLLLRAK